MINKRYKDIFDQYSHKGESSPFNIGTLVVCALCFLILMVSTFTQFNFYQPWFIKTDETAKLISYTPQIPAMIFIIYILGKPFSILMLSAYLIVGFFVWPIFVLGGGIEYIQNYIFGYFLGLFFAIFIVSFVLKKGQGILYRLLGAVLGVVAIHLFGIFYCFILALFKVIDFNAIIPIVSVISGNKITYDLFFSCAIISIAPFIKDIFWICMKPKPDLKKKLKYTSKRN